MTITTTHVIKKREKKNKEELIYYIHHTIKPGSVLFIRTIFDFIHDLLPGAYKHCAYYYGQGFQSDLINFLMNNPSYFKKFKKKYKLESRTDTFVFRWIRTKYSNSIKYIVEFNKKGFVVRNLIDFLRTTDIVAIFKLNLNQFSSVMNYTIMYNSKMFIFYFLFTKYSLFLKNNNIQFHKTYCIKFVIDIYRLILNRYHVTMNFIPKRGYLLSHLFTQPNTFWTPYYIVLL